MPATEASAPSPSPFDVKTFAAYAPLALHTEAPTINAFSQIVFALPRLSIRPAEEPPAISPYAVWPVAPVVAGALPNDPLLRLLHGVIGLCTEAGELLRAWADHRHAGKAKSVDLANVKEELGDAWWYVPVVLDAGGIVPDWVDAIIVETPKPKKPEKTGALVDGLAIKALNLLELAKKRLYYPRAIDEADFGNRLGELIQVLVRLCYAFDWDPYDVMSANLYKLNAAGRYKDGFTTREALNRDTGAEMMSMGELKPGQYDDSKDVVDVDTGRLVVVGNDDYTGGMSPAMYERTHPGCVFYPGYGFKVEGQEVAA